MHRFPFFYLFIIFLSLTFGVNLRAENFTIKSEYWLNHSDNVDSTHTKQIDDYYSDFIGIFQKKDEIDRLRFKLKLEKFQKVTIDDNVFFNASYQRTPNKTFQFLFELYNQSYRGNPITHVENNSDNKGTKLSLTINKDLREQVSIYYTVSGQYKNYQKQKRNDSILDGAVGLYTEFLSSFSFGPEFNLEYDYSTDPFNTNYNLSPGFYSNLRLNDHWDFILSSYYTYIQYIKKSISETDLTKEHQAFWGTSLTCNYKITKLSFMALKLGLNHNFSNNTQSIYNARFYSFNIGLNF